MTTFTIEAAAHEVAVRQAAAWLATAGVSRDDRILIEGANHPGVLEVAHGALRSGIDVCLLPPYVAPTDREDLLARLRPRLVISDPSGRPWAGCRERPDLAPHPLGRPMFATSGTSGQPKLVHPVRLDETDAAALAADEDALWRPDPGRAQLVCSPLTHSAGFRSATAALLAGGSVRLLERFDPTTVLASLADPTTAGAFLVPTHLRRIIALDPDPLPTVERRILHAGEPCPPILKERACALLGELGEFYGSTEGQFTLLEPDRWRAFPGSVGFAREGRQIEIRDPDPGGVGTIWCHAPGFTRFTYLDDPAATAAAWDADAFTVGDLGRLSPEGALWIEARREDLIITGGVNCYPAAIEAAILEHEGVDEVAVVGVPDPEWGQRIVAVVAATDPSGLDGFLRERLSGPQRPKRLVIVDALPRTDSGKIDRARIRASLEGGPPGSGESTGT